MTIAGRRLKVKVMCKGQGHGQTNAVGLTSIEGSFSSYCCTASVIHPRALWSCFWLSYVYEFQINRLNPRPVILNSVLGC